MSVNIHEAKTHFSKLVERAATGEEIIIAKAGKPLALLVPLERSPRRSGRLRGQVWIAGDFDETPEEVIDLFSEGEPARG